MNRELLGDKQNSPPHLIVILHAPYRLALDSYPTLGR